MRIGFLVALALVAGCGDDGSATESDLSVGADLSRAAGDLAGADLVGSASDLTMSANDLAVGANDLATSGADLAASPDLASGGSDGGGVGAPCATACDCMPGLACAAGMCVLGIVPVYCCGSATCPPGEQCQDPNGAMRFCGGFAGDGGGVSCAMINCKNGGDALCMQLGCTSCVPQGNKMVCAP